MHINEDLVSMLRVMKIAHTHWSSLVSELHENKHCVQGADLSSLVTTAWSIPSYRLEKMNRDDR